MDILSLSPVLEPTPIQSDLGHHLFKVKSYFLLKGWKKPGNGSGKREAEAEAEAVEGRLEEAEAEAKEKLTAVPSLQTNMYYTNIIIQDIQMLKSQTPNSLLI